MSDQGFHEVQLSGKQLVFLFMSAIVLLVVTFLLGVNVGRGVRNAVGDTGISAQANPPPATPDDAAKGADPAKPAEPELSYHDMLLGAGAPGNKTPPVETPTPTPVTGTAPPPVSEPVPTGTPAPALPTPPATTPAATTPAPTSTKTPAAAPRASSSDWFLQTGAYSTQAVAEGQVAKLKELNVPAFVDVGIKLFRVRIGPYTDRAEAEQVKSRIARQGFPSSITR